MAALRPSILSGGRASLVIGPSSSGRPLPFEFPSTSPLPFTPPGGPTSGTHASHGTPSARLGYGYQVSSDGASSPYLSAAISPESSVYPIGLSPPTLSSPGNAAVFPHPTAATTHTATSQAGTAVVSSSVPSFAVHGRNMHPVPRSAGRSHALPSGITGHTTNSSSTATLPSGLDAGFTNSSAPYPSGQRSLAGAGRICSARVPSQSHKTTASRIASATPRHTQIATNESIIAGKSGEALFGKRQARRQPSPTSKGRAMFRLSEENAGDTPHNSTPYTQFSAKARISVPGGEIPASSLDSGKSGDEGRPTRVRLKCIFNGEARLTYVDNNSFFDNIVTELSESYRFVPVLRYTDPLDGDLIMLANQRDLEALITSVRDSNRSETVPTIIVQVSKPHVTAQDAHKYGTPEVADSITSSAVDLSSSSEVEERQYRPREVFAAAGNGILNRTSHDEIIESHVRHGDGRISEAQVEVPRLMTAHALHGGDAFAAEPPRPPPSASGPRPRIIADDDAEMPQISVPTTFALRKTESVPFQTAGAFRWKRGDEIGRGGYGVVYLGLKDTGELMAVKQLDTKGISAKELNDVEHEVDVLRSLDHDNIVRYYGTQRTDDTLSIFLEYAPGGSIRQLLTKFGFLEERVIRTYTRQLLLGLEYLHGHGIAHRDIKGGNVLVAADGTVKLADFGASQKVGSTTGAGTGTSRKPVRPEYNGDTDAVEGVAGTPFWMAPEVIQETQQSNRDGTASRLWKKADIWSVGCTAIEMATGRPPWSELDNPMTAMYVISCTEQTPAIPAHLSTTARDFLRLCLQRDPSKRPGVSQLLLHPFVAPAQANQSSHPSGRASRLSGVPSTTLHSYLPPRPSTSSGADRDNVSQRSIAAMQQRIQMRALLEEDERLREQEQSRTERRAKSIRESALMDESSSGWPQEAFPTKHADTRRRHPSASVVAVSQAKTAKDIANRDRAHTAAARSHMMFHGDGVDEEPKGDGLYGVDEVEAEFGNADGESVEHATIPLSWNDRAVLDSLRMLADSPRSQSPPPDVTHLPIIDAAFPLASRASDRSDALIRPASQATARSTNVSPLLEKRADSKENGLGWRTACSPFDSKEAEPGFFAAMSSNEEAGLEKRLRPLSPTSAADFHLHHTTLSYLRPKSGHLPRATHSPIRSRPNEAGRLGLASTSSEPYIGCANASPPSRGDRSRISPQIIGNPANSAWTSPLDAHDRPVPEVESVIIAPSRSPIRAVEVVSSSNGWHPSQMRAGTLAGLSDSSSEGLYANEDDDAAWPHPHSPLSHRH